jgi:two-component system chemotaxis response regulator CheB
VEPEGFALSTEDMVQYSRPSIDVLFDSAADAYADELAAVVLTGANADGAYGLERVKRRGGVTIVQDPSSAEKRDMPQAAIATGAADHVLPLERIASKLVELTA